MPLKQLSDIELHGKTLLIREDFNVPLAENGIRDDTRIQAALPTIQYALSKGAKVIVLSHLGRPVEGVFDEKLSLSPVAEHLGMLLSQPVPLVTMETVPALAPGQCCLLENVRFLSGEKENDAALAKRLASLGDVFVMDAFAAAHRAHASTCGIIEYMSEVCAGPLLVKEISALSQALNTPKKPVVAIIGGAKVSTKLGVLSALIPKVDHLIVGGGMANTFLAAQGFSVGTSLKEDALISQAKALLAQADTAGTTVHLPKDVVVSTTLSDTALTRTIPLEEITPEEAIFDIGPQTQTALAACLMQAGTIVWNGPVGVFEMAPFAKGTQALTAAVAASPAFSIAGGGDTLAAIAAFGASDNIDYISTGGGAFLEWMEQGSLVCIAALEAKG